MTDNFTEEEKNGFYKAIYSRRDVRSHFTSKTIDEKILEEEKELIATIRHAHPFKFFDDEFY